MNNKIVENAGILTENHAFTFRCIFTKLSLIVMEIEENKCGKNNDFVAFIFFLSMACRESTLLAYIVVDMRVANETRMERT